MTGSVAYLYDGTLEGILCAVLETYEQHEQPEDIATPARFAPRLGQRVRTIETDFGRAQRVRRGIVRTCGSATFDAIAKAACTDDPNKGIVVYRFIRYAMDSPNSKPCSGCARKHHCSTPCSRPQSAGVLNELAHPDVAPLRALEKSVDNECENMRQFIRFEHAADGSWFAVCNPKADLMPYIMGWFNARFNTQRFIIYDEVHHTVGMSDDGRWSIAKTDTLNLPQLASEERLMQTAWQGFYDALSIDERYNPELRTHFMPQRFWKHLTEMAPRPQRALAHPSGRTRE